MSEATSQPTPTPPSQPTPTTPPPVPYHRSVSHQLRLVNQSIHIETALLFHLITQSIKHMEKMHVRQIMTLKVKYMERKYISRSDFKTIVAVFKRYKDKEEDSEYTKKLTEALAEAEALEVAAEQLMKTLVRYDSTNFKIRKRPVPA